MTTDTFNIFPYVQINYQDIKSLQLLATYIKTSVVQWLFIQNAEKIYKTLKFQNKGAFFSNTCSD